MKKALDFRGDNDATWIRAIEYSIGDRSREREIMASSATADRCQLPGIGIPPNLVLNSDALPRAV